VRHASLGRDECRVGSGSAPVLSTSLQAAGPAASHSSIDYDDDGQHIVERRTWLIAAVQVCEPAGGRAACER